ncbi:gamma-glutamyltransferase [Falsiroseomonas sp. HW251]|uniref:gamma-glutamyltransferase n=1 Tax=Falsiroseomonas sp. HW251 TaxID=3390998 RepID=UPI003D321105
MGRSAHSNGRHGSGRATGTRRRLVPAAGLALMLALPGCSTINSATTAVGNFLGGSSGPPAGAEGFVRGFLGYVVAEEPRAALAARNVLSAGGTAADAAAAAGFMMTVTLPSRAGLGGGGACLMFNPRRAGTEAIVFPPGARSSVPADADRPAAVPMMARGLFLLHTRGGRLPFEQAVGPAEQAARFGVEVSNALATDLAAVAGPLFADPWSQAIFAGPNGQPLTTGARLVQGDLAATFATLRTSGIGDMYQGGLARRLEETSATAGGGLTVADLRASVGQVVAPQQVRVGNDVVSFLSATDRGAAAAAFNDGNPQAGPAGGATLPASTGLVAVDREGMAVSCAFTMNNLFGTGRVAPGTGMVLAAAPNIGRVTPPLLSAAVAHNANLRAFRAAVAGSGQEMAAAAVAVPMAAMLRGQDATNAVRAVPEPGRAVAVGCLRYLPGAPEACAASADPRGSGLAVGSDR